MDLIHYLLLFRTTQVMIQVPLIGYKRLLEYHLTVLQVPLFHPIVSHSGSSGCSLQIFSETLFIKDNVLQWHLYSWAPACGGRATVGVCPAPPPAKLKISIERFFGEFFFLCGELFLLFLLYVFFLPCSPPPL